MAFTSPLPTPLTYLPFKHLGLPFAFSMPSLPCAANARRATFLLMLIFFVFFNTGCGGTPEYPVDEASGNSVSQTSNASYAADQMNSLSSSFTVNPTDNFNGFNPEDWNRQQSWVECNCGNNRPAEPQIMTWNPNT